MTQISEIPPLRLRSVHETGQESSSNLLETGANKSRACVLQSPREEPKVEVVRVHAMTPRTGLQSPLPSMRGSTTILRASAKKLPWDATQEPVTWLEAFCFKGSDRKAVQKLLLKVDSQLSSPITPFLAKNFRVIFFDRETSNEQRQSALRHTSATQQAFLEPVDAFLKACVECQRQDKHLPAESVRMLQRLNLFLDECLVRPAQLQLSISRGVERSPGYSRLDDERIVFRLPPEVRDRFAELAAETTARVSQNCQLFRSICSSLEEIESLQRFVEQI